MIWLLLPDGIDRRVGLLWANWLLLADQTLYFVPCCIQLLRVLTLYGVLGEERLWAWSCRQAILKSDWVLRFLQCVPNEQWWHNSCCVWFWVITVNRLPEAVARCAIASIWRQKWVHLPCWLCIRILIMDRLRHHRIVVSCILSARHLHLSIELSWAHLVGLRQVFGTFQLLRFALIYHDVSIDFLCSFEFLIIELALFNKVRHLCIHLWLDIPKFFRQSLNL